MSKTASNILSGVNLCMGHSGIAAGTTTTITTAALVISINGKAYSIGAASNGATPTTDYNTGAAFKPIVAGQACVFVVGYDAGGTRRAMQGPIISLDEYTGKLTAADFPDVPSDVAAVGYLFAQGGSTLASPWTFGSSNTSGVTGMTYTFQAVNWLPSKPVAA